MKSTLLLCTFRRAAEEVAETIRRKGKDAAAEDIAARVRSHETMAGTEEDSGIAQAHVGLALSYATALPRREEPKAAAPRRRPNYVAELAGEGLL